MFKTRVLDLVSRIKLGRQVRRVNKEMKSTISDYPAHYENIAGMFNVVTRQIGFGWELANEELYSKLHMDIECPYNNCLELLGDISNIIGSLMRLEPVVKDSLKSTAVSNKMTARDFFTVDSRFVGTLYFHNLVTTYLEVASTIRSIEKNHSAKLPQLQNTIDILHRRMEFLWLISNIPLSALRNASMDDLEVIYGRKE